MDPLSITASTLTVLTALETTFSLIRSFRDAPGQLEALSNEVTDITAIVTEIDQMLHNTHENDGTPDGKERYLVRALCNIQDKVQKLEILVQSCSRSGATKISRTAWLRVKSKAQNLQVELRDGRLNLALALGTFSAYISLSISNNSGY